MSASLVGSEMCIRDSGVGVAVDVGVGVGVGVVGVGVGVCVGVGVGVGGCLLYTSDAADDM
eukprot:9560799-Alexandrium_andersonii.AAC.1